MVCMFAMVVIQSYIFIPTTDIYFLKFVPQILPLMEPPNLKFRLDWRFIS